MDPEIRMLRTTIRRFVDERLAPLEHEVDETGTIAPAVAAALKAEAKALGFFALNMPESVGGGGLTHVQMCHVEEEFGRTSDALIRRTFGQVYPMLLKCAGDQIETYLKPTVAGDKICAMAITEPGAGSDAAAITTTARRDGDSWVLNGTKHFISDGDIADYVILLAVTDRDKGARGGMTLFLVDRDSPGFQVARLQKMMGHRGYGHAELVFEDCRIPAANVLGEVGDGFRIIMGTVAGIRLGHIGARAVGLATRILDMCTEYAQQRRQFGQPIAEFQMIQQLLADSATDIFATRAMVQDVAAELDRGIENRTKISMVKLFASEMATRAADRGIQIFGGMGFSKDMPLERFYRDTRVLRIFDGTSEIHRMLIARGLFKHGAEHF
jgi:acyl-CoA dehydrogenase